MMAPLFLLLVQLLAPFALAQGSSDNNVELRVTPMDPPPLMNGSNLSLTCDASPPSSQPLLWSLCIVLDCTTSIRFPHRVEAAPDGSRSVLHLSRLTMPKPGEQEGLYFLCHIGHSVTTHNLQHVTTVFVGVPPFPVKDLHCASRDQVNFNCSWSPQGYTGLRTRSTVFKYRQLGDSEWNIFDLDEGLNEFQGRALAYTMQISVAQTNELGTSNATIINFSALTETIPNRPEDVAVTFSRDAEDVIGMQMSWGLPQQWTKSSALLEYMISYRDSRTGKTTMVPRIIETDRRYNVPDVLPYTAYTIRVKCKVGGAANWSDWSAPIEAVSLETAPSGEVTALDLTTLANRDPFKRDVLLAWQPPRERDRHGMIRGYLLDVSPSTQPNNITDPQFLLQDLKRFESYEVRLTAYTLEGAIGPYKTIDIPDLTTAPAEVKNFKAVSETPNTILVAWNKTTHPRGVVTGYTVKWHELDHPSNIQMSQLSGGTKQHQLANLKPYTQYRISIIVHNKMGQSLPVVGIATTQFANPTQPLNLRPHKSTPTKLSLIWDDPAAWNGPPRGFEVHYRPSQALAEDSTNKTVSVNRVPLAVNCSAFEEAVPFTFLVFASTGTSEVDRLLGEPAILEREMCGPSYSITGIIIGVLIAAFCVMCLLLCLFTVKRPIMKPSPDPYFIDGILGPPNDKFKINSRLATRRQEKEDYDVLKTCESVRGLIGQRSEPGSAKGSMSSSAGSSSDQGFHEMAPDLPIIAQYSNIGLGGGEALEAKPYTRCSSGYGHSLQSQSEQDLLQKQRMLSPSEEYAEGEDVFDECPEDVDSGGPRGEFVNSYRTVPNGTGPASAKESRPRSAPPVEATGIRGFAPMPPPPLNDSLSMDYCQMGVNLPQPAQPRNKETSLGTTDLDKRRSADEQDPEVDISYTKVALENGGKPSDDDDPSRLYHSVWPSTPEGTLDAKPSPHDPTAAAKLAKPAATSPSSSPGSPWPPGGFVTDLGFNNNSKEIPSVHSPSFVPSPEATVAAAAKPEATAAPRLASVDSEDYIDIVGGNSSPRANTALLGTSPPTSFALQPKGLNGDLSCQDYIRQCDLPPASPLENMV